MYSGIISKRLFSGILHHYLQHSELSLLFQIMTDPFRFVGSCFLLLSLSSIILSANLHENIQNLKLNHRLKIRLKREADKLNFILPHHPNPHHLAPKPHKHSRKSYDYPVPGVPFLGEEYVAPIDHGYKPPAVHSAGYDDHHSIGYAEADGRYKYAAPKNPLLYGHRCCEGR